MWRVLVLAGALALGGCGSPPKEPTRDETLRELTREYAEPADRVIKAAEAVLRHAYSGKLIPMEVHHNRNGFITHRPYSTYLVVATSSGVEKWDFSTDPRPNGVLASVSISDTAQVQGRYSHAFIDTRSRSMPLFRLFWSRVDYVLGRRAEWVTCNEAIINAPDDSQHYFGTFCANLDSEPAIPPQLPRIAVAAPPAPAKPPVRRR